MNASDYLKRSALYRKLVYGPYREFARVYAAKMSNEGLGRRCTWCSLSLFRDLMDWHIGIGHDPQDLSEVHVDRFLEHRFKHWSPDTGDRSALRRLLSALREEGLIPAPSRLSALSTSRSSMYSRHICRMREGSPPRRCEATSCCHIDFCGRSVLPAQMGLQRSPRRASSVMSSDMRSTAPPTVAKPCAWWYAPSCAICILRALFRRRWPIACRPSAAGDLPAFQHSCHQRRSRRFSTPVIGRRQWVIGTMRF